MLQRHSVSVLYPVCDYFVYYGSWIVRRYRNQSKQYLAGPERTFAFTVPNSSLCKRDHNNKPKSKKKTHKKSGQKC